MDGPVSESSAERAAPVRLHVTEAAVASIAAATAVGVPGVATALTSDAVSGGAATDGSATSEAAAVAMTVEMTVEVAIAARLGHNCRDLAAAVQEAVGRAVAEQTGRPARVTVTVADVILE